MTHETTPAVYQKVLFLDIDGPMIPRRAYFLPNQTGVVSIFDPVAVSLLLKVLEDSGAKIVISSTWGNHGQDLVKETLEKNGISWNYVHPDWVTPRKMSSSRDHEIKWWLQKHKEVTHWVSLDDEKLAKNNVRVSFEDGMQWRHYLELLKYLDVKDD